MTSSSTPPRDWIVAQLGAREHYAVARALQRSGRLRRLYTDVWCPAWLQPTLRALPGPFRSFANRHHPEISASKVQSFPVQTVRHALQRRILGEDRTDHGYYRHHIRVGSDFADLVRASMEQSYSSLEDLGFFGYSTGSLEALTYLSPTSCFTVLDQISPGKVEKEIVLDESERWPGWATTLPVLHPSFQERLEKEWHLASRVLVNSEWSKEALVEQGVSAAKIAVVPLAYDPPTARPHTSAPPTDRSLRVLWLGTVNLRKGIPYLLKAAKQLLPRNVEVRIVGPLQITEKARAFAPSNVEFVGRVPRDKVSAEYRDADVFVLPTLSDGFAITQLEAMAHGLPVIATPRCGRVVTDGRDGFVVPVRDADRLAAAIATLDDDRDRVASMSQNALQTSQNYTLSHLAQRLRAALPA